MIKTLLPLAIEAATEAGKIILKYYRKDNITSKKIDGSPLTLADQESHLKICELLEKTDYIIVSEEGDDHYIDENIYWLVDPLDGTKDYLAANDEFTVNIALVNELAMLFNELDIDTLSVLEAAGTKWNFLPFRPGLVGGHCISVDPYYLTYKANQIGFNPEIILAGRYINDRMSFYIADQVSKLMIIKKISLINANVLIMGLAFKENCPDIRNTRVIGVIQEFRSFNCNVDVYDPWIDKQEFQNEYEITPIDDLKNGYYDAVILAVAHNEFKEMGVEQLNKLGRKNHVLYDIKYILKKDEVDGRL